MNIDKRMIPCFRNTMLESIFNQWNQQQRRQGLFHIFNVIIKIDMQRFIITQFFKSNIIADDLQFLFYRYILSACFIKHKTQYFRKA